MKNNKLLSICIPCCGRLNYVRKTLFSIYQTEASLDLFEVILSDNSPNFEIEQLCQEFNYRNLHYYKTNCEGFMNSYYALTYGTGKLLKLHNSQSMFNVGSIEKILNQVAENQHKNPVIFYTNGLLGKFKSIDYDTYDTFMYNLTYWSSWSNGFSIWKEDFERIENLNLNALFPHTSILVTQYSALNYIINDEILFDIQIIQKRGGHNKFKAFTIDYPSIVCDCCERNIISVKSKQRILDDVLKEFLPSLVFNKYIARIETFEAVNFTENIKKYYPRWAVLIVLMYTPLVPFRLVYRKLMNKFYK